MVRKTLSLPPGFNSMASKGVQGARDCHLAKQKKRASQGQLS